MKEIKPQLITVCKQLLKERLHKAQEAMTAIEEALTSETKSSAGDKHETGRAMLQLEREKNGQRLAEAEQTNRYFSAIDFESQPDRVKLGSLVKTEEHYYFISVSLGAVTVQNTPVFCISLQSPIGKLLLGKTKEETITFNGKAITVQDIY
ncbi:3-oxoacyl-ACP synthase [Galbibacter sp. EGI 63066]|uniref:3-oxoacyl-ACP synthase n=1 Tax=Galbibacter sp. EGI 63066 TaxID=2993559 RepID=UPI002249860F|nr:3-oxoacyl-ACP synthase [Galbibacter sp. EGI 63066]MCX2678970.1 3-oxoacyl-ACP synthase [Galbibacter sp. EGI 63066]